MKLKEKIEIERDLHGVMIQVWVRVFNFMGIWVWVF
jgi:hypothetical protein